MPSFICHHLPSRAAFECAVGLLLGCCGLARAAAAVEPAPTNPVVVPFEIRRGHVMVPARVTNSSPLSLLLDTGYSLTMLNPELIANFGLRRTGRITIVGIAGEEPAEVYEGPPLDFSGVIWKPRRVAAFTQGGGRSRRRDGILGSAFFRRFVVDIDPRRKELRLHEPDIFSYAGAGEVLPLTFSGDTPAVEAIVRLPDTSEVKARFEVDTGCDGSLCLGRHFVESHRLVPADSPAGGGNRFGVGGSTRTRSSHLPQLRLGRLTITGPAADLFLEGSPVDPPYAGHIGWDLLKDFRVVFDYRRRQMVLEQLRP